jgi:hypothetical protein
LDDENAISSRGEEFPTRFSPFEENSTISLKSLISKKYIFQSLFLSDEYMRKLPSFDHA